MCGRFVSASDPDGLARFFVVDDRRAEPLEPRYNVAPSQPVYAVVEHAQRRHLVTFRWGLVPAWAHDMRIGGRLINARTETVEEKPAFRDSFRLRRCLIPADGFYEWQREQRRRTPHFIFADGREPLAFAGLWSVWRDPGHRRDPTNRDPVNRQPVRSCAILTTASVGPVAALHDRMPVALPPSAWDLWLDRSVRDGEALRHLLASVRPPVLRMHAVSTEVNRPANDHPGLIAPASGEGPG